MTEQQVQAKRIKELESQGYYVIKLADVLFSEIKTKRGNLSKLQEYRLKELDGCGFRTEIYRG